MIFGCCFRLELRLSHKTCNAKSLVCMSRASISNDCNAAKTRAVAVDDASNAAPAVCASKLTPSVIVAMSGGESIRPCPVTVNLPDSASIPKAAPTHNAAKAAKTHRIC